MIHQWLISDSFVIHKENSWSLLFQELFVPEVCQALSLPKAWNRCDVRLRRSLIDHLQSLSSSSSSYVLEEAFSKESCEPFLEPNSIRSEVNSQFFRFSSLGVSGGNSGSSTRFSDKTWVYASVQPGLPSFLRQTHVGLTNRKHTLRLMIGTETTICEHTNREWRLAIFFSSPSNSKAKRSHNFVDLKMIFASFLQALARVWMRNFEHVLCKGLSVVTLAGPVKVGSMPNVRMISYLISISYHY